MRRFAQSTAYTVTFMLFLSSDHVTVATGKTVAITLSKAGGAFANPNAGATNATEISNGLYKVALDTTDTNTLGDLVIRGTAAASDDMVQIMQVVSATTGGATNLDAAISSLSIPTANANADALLDRAAGIETGLTPRQGLRLMAAALLGKASGMATTTGKFRDTGDTKDRITATVDADGNRTAVTLDAS